MLNKLKEEFDFIDIVWIAYIFVSYTFYMKAFYMPVNFVTLFLRLLPFVFIGKTFLFDGERYLTFDYRKYLSLIWYAVFIAYEFVISQLNIVEYSVWRVVSSNMVLIFCMCYSIDSMKRFERILYDYAIAVLGFAIVAWATSPISTYGTLDFGGIPQRQRNVTAYLVGMAFAVFVFKYVQKRRKFDVIAAVICMIVTLLTGSRKGVLQLILPFLIMLFCQEDAKRFIKYIVLGGIVGAIVLAILLNNEAFMSVYGERMLAIFNDAGDMSDMSVYARNMLKLIGLYSFLQNPIWGYGLGASWTLVERTGYSFVNYFHNNFIEILTCGGIIGFILYHWIVIKNLFVVFKRRKVGTTYPLLLTIIIAFLVLSWGQVTVYYTHFMIICFFIVQCGKYIKDFENENSNSNSIQQHE
jgi:O-antigen ligase